MLISLLAIAAATAQPQPLRKFGDWVVGCDNVLSCRAVGYQLEGEDEFYGLSVSRSGDPAALPKIRLDVDGVVAVANGDASDRWATYSPLHFDENHELSAGDVGPLLQRIAESAQKLKYVDATGKGLARILPPQKLEFVDATGKVVARISLKGASAALRWMDERQGRADTVTALVAKGPRSASSVPNPPLLPAIQLPAHSSKAPTKLVAAQITKIRKSYDCWAREDEAVEYYRLDGATTLAMVPCWSAAYQEGSVAMLVSDRGQYRAAIMEFGARDDNNLTEPEFNLPDLSLWTFYKGRGLADCGFLKAYVWDGSRFRLSYWTDMDECRGARDHFITLWRTANHPEY